MMYTLLGLDEEEGVVVNVSDPLGVVKGVDWVEGPNPNPNPGTVIQWA